MLRFESILVPTDLGRGSAEAIRYAFALRRGDGAPAAGARILVVEVVPPGARGSPDELRRFIEGIAGGAEPRTEATVVEGDPRTALPEAARVADLIVIGATSRAEPEPGAPTPGLGGVAEAVVRRSRVPVLVVKWPGGADPLALVPHLPLAMREIVFPTDFTAESAQALRYALGFAFAYGARVTALHVAASGREIAGRERMPFPLAEEIDRFYEKDLGWQRDELGRFLRDRLGVERPIEVRERVRAGRAAEEIAAECAELGADLLVMAARGGTHGPLWHALLGSVADRALRLAACPVLIVPPVLSPPVVVKDAPPGARQAG